MRAIRLLPLICALAAPMAVATAAAFEVNPPPSRSSSKAARITPDIMFDICGYNEQDEPFFLDNEYRRAIAELSDMIARSDPSSVVIERIAFMRDTLEACRENDLNKRNAKRAMRSCRALIKNHDDASSRAEFAFEFNNLPRSLVQRWGARFRAPVEKCLKSMRCRLDNKQDLAETLAVYRQIVDQMQGWLLEVDGLDQMKICGSTIRDVKNWCTSHSAHDPRTNTTEVRDMCTDARTLMLTIELLQNIRIRRFPSTPGGTVQAGAAP